MRSRLVIACAVALFFRTSTAQTFLRSNGQPDRDERGLVLFRSVSGAIFLGGGVADSALVQRIDMDGQVLWSRTFKVPGQEPNMVFQFADAPDGTIIGCGNGVNSSLQPREASHFKFDQEGNFQWIRYWNEPEAYNRAIFSTSNNELMLLSCYYETGTGTTWTDYFQSRVDPLTGDAVWTSGRQDLYNAVPYIDDATSAVSVGGEFYLTGRIYTNGSPQSTCRVNLTKVDAQGQHLWTRFLLYPNSADRRMYGCDIIANDDSLTIAYSGNVVGSEGVYTVGLVRTDDLGNVAWARNYDVVGSTSEVCSKLIATPFGYVLAGRTVGSGFQRAFLLGLSPLGDVLWSRVYGVSGDVHTAPHTYVKNLIALDDGFLFTWADRDGSDDDLLLARTDEQGLIACGDVGDIEVETTQLPEATFDPTTQTIPFTTSLEMEGVGAGMTSIPDECDIPLDLGPDTAVCAAFTVQTGIPGASFVWQDGSTGDSLVITDSGVFWVTATLGCCTRTDSIAVVLGSGAGVDLGPDVLLCGSGTVVLDVGQEWEEVVWSDGSEGSTLVVQVPGPYWVWVSSDGCSAVDTVQVDQIDPPIFDLGPDTAICEDNGVVLTPQQPGSQHLWSDGTSGDSLVVYSSGSYWVEVGPVGCSTVDTINILLLPVPVVDLGPDTVFCGAVSLTLQSGYSAESTTWSSTPDHLAVIQITGPGAYWVQVSLDGCVASDTISIGLEQLPMVELMADTTLCERTTLIISPIGFSGGPVIWSDGSSGPSVVVGNSGTWTATVENTCGISTDSVVIEMIDWSDPVGEYQVCSGESVHVGLPGGATSISWSTGSDQAEVQLPEGTFTFQLIDVFGCPRQGTITVISASDMDGLAFVPNVFTPNADGLNDTFRVVGADHDRYELSVFNRWGEHIFNTTDPERAWDGNYKDKPVPAGTYVYVLRYADRCRNGRMVDRPGHVTLLR